MACVSNLTIYCLILSVIFPVLAKGQAPVPIKAQIVTLSWEGNIKDLWYQGPKEPEKLDIYESGFTMPFEFTGPPEIAFYKNKADLALPPEKRPPPMAVAKLPSSGGSLLLFFTAIPDKPDHWEIRTLDNSLKNFPPGAYRVFNLTETPIQIAIDKTFYPPIESKGKKSPTPRNGVTATHGGPPFLFIQALGAMVGWKCESSSKQ
jgi:hypothetical protein